MGRYYAKVNVINCEDEFSFVIEVITEDLKRVEELLIKFQRAEKFASENDYVRMLKDNNIEAKGLDYAIEV